MEVRRTVISSVRMVCICIVARGEEVGRQVGRRLAAGLHHPGDGARIALAADQEDSPLQSKRSSMFSNKRQRSNSLISYSLSLSFLILCEHSCSTNCICYTFKYY